MKRVVLAGALAVTLAALSAQDGSSLPAGWRNWRYSAPLTVAPARTGLAAVRIPPAVTGRSLPGLSDVRLIDNAGQEVPFVLHAHQEKVTLATRPSRLLEVSFAPGENTQGIVDLGRDPGEHNSLEVSIGQPDYFLWVELAISPDARTWRVLNERSPIYRFTSSSLEGNQTIRYSTTRARYLRVRLLEGSKKMPLSGVRVLQAVRQEAERVRSDTSLQPEIATAPQETWWRADMADSRELISEARFDIGQAEFHRAVRIRASDDGQQWRVVGQGDVFRVKPRAPLPAGDDGIRERLRVSFPEAQARFWRVEILNRNDPPLADVRASLFATPRRAVFRPSAGRTYRLLVDNPRAVPPQYEMARLTSETDLETAAESTVGELSLNPDWADPAPWTERYPYVLWVAALAAVVVLGVLAVQALR